MPTKSSHSTLDFLGSVLAIQELGGPRRAELWDPGDHQIHAWKGPKDLCALWDGSEDRVCVTPCFISHYRRAYPSEIQCQLIEQKTQYGFCPTEGYAMY